MKTKNDIIAAYSYKAETRTIAASLLGRTSKEITEFVIRDAAGEVYATAPAAWTEADVAAQVAHLNENAKAAGGLRAELGEDGYAKYQDENDAG